MLAGYHPVLQALLGTLFTWALTAAGSALVFIFSRGQVSHQRYWPVLKMHYVFIADIIRVQNDRLLLATAVHTLTIGHVLVLKRVQP